jgi:hypothetical protein
MACNSQTLNPPEQRGQYHVPGQGAVHIPVISLTQKAAPSGQSGKLTVQYM